MERTNFCRNLRRAMYNDEVIIAPFFENKDIAWVKEQHAQVYSALLSSEKFILPPNGLSLLDNELRALSSGGPIRIPFPSVALEFRGLAGENVSWADIRPEKFNLLRNIVVAYERRGAEGDKVQTYIALFSSLVMNAKWALTDLCCFDISNAFFSTDLSSPPQDYRGGGMSGNQIGVLYNFLNALACKNVHVETEKAKAKGKALKSPFPFDDYHYLTVSVQSNSKASSRGADGPHRSPREHIRRGHIRRLESGPIWVNSTLVNPGIGGKINKEYFLGVQ